MPCTTVLVGRLASNDGSTMIARTEDGHFDVKRMTAVPPNKQPRKYRSKKSHVEIELPDHPMGYSACPNVNPEEGIWAAHGINDANVGMTATETITTNPRVLSADPMVVYEKAKSRNQKDQIGGIGEEDFVVLVLPYVRTAREGVLRLGSLLETWGTYESNGIAFNDEKEVWWLETIGGHHWMARRVPEDSVVLAPNQFAMDAFDLEEAFGKQEAHLCSKDLREFIAENHLDLNQGGKFNPRDVFGSRRDQDHIYNTPRAWFMGRYLAPESHRWEGPDAEFTPESDNIPWCLVPDRKVTVEDVEYLLSGHYQGTPYNPYTNRDTGMRGMYRSIGINRTGVTSICQIRPDRAQKGLQWLSFGSTTFGAFLPLFPHVEKMPDYVSKVTMDPTTENFYWASRLLGALADSQFSACIQEIGRYQDAVTTEGRRIVRAYDARNTNDPEVLAKANEELCAMARQKTAETLGRVLSEVSQRMRNGFQLSDN